MPANEMQYALVVQHGDTIPRVTHHSTPHSAQLEFAMWLATTMDPDSIFLAVDLDECPKLVVGVAMAWLGGFACLIEARSSRPYFVAIHMWSGADNNQIKISRMKSKSEALEYACECVAKEEQKQYLRRKGYFCITTSDEGPIVHADVFIVNTLKDSETLIA